MANPWGFAILGGGGRVELYRNSGLAVLIVSTLTSVKAPVVASS